MDPLGRDPKYSKEPVDIKLYADFEDLAPKKFTLFFCWNNDKSDLTNKFVVSISILSCKSENGSLFLGLVPLVIVILPEPPCILPIVKLLIE